MSIYEALLESSKSVSNSKSSSIQEDTSMFEYTLSLLEEVNNTFTSDHLSAFNETIVSDYIAPAISARFNFVRLTNDMINLNVDSINKVYSKSEAIMKSVTKSDDRIKPYVNDILNFNESFRMNEPFYNFTNLDIDIPPYDLNRRVEDEFNMIYQKVRDIVSDNDKSLAEKEDNIMTLYMNLSGDGFSKSGVLYTTKNEYKLDEKLLKGIFDKMSINTSLIYSDTDSYEKQVYAFFRDGSLDPNVEVVTPDILKTAFNRYNNSKITMRRLRAAKDELVKSYIAIKKTAEKSYDQIYAILPTENMKIYMDKIMRYEVVKNMYYLNGYDLIFSGRLDANIHAMLQDKKMCLYAANIIMNGKINVESFDYVSTIVEFKQSDDVDGIFLEEMKKVFYNTDSVLREYAYENYKISLENMSSILELENNINMLTEDTELVLEGKIIDNIKRIISNWMKNTSLAWKRFKELAVDKKYTDFINNNMKYLTMEGKMNIPEEFELPQPDKIDKFENIDFPLFDMNMITDLDTKENFIKSRWMNMYSNYIKDGKTIKEVAMEDCFTKATANMVATLKTTIQPYTGWIDEYHNKIDTCTKNIESLNRATDAILKAIEQEQHNANVEESSLFDYYLNEADDKGNNQQQNTQTTNTAQPNQANNTTEKKTNDAWKSADGNKQVKEKTKNYTKEVNNYFGVCTEIVSADMAILNKARNKMFTVLQKWVDMQKNASGEGKKEKANNGETKVEVKQTTTKGNDNLHIDTKS
jgi:hypothetical protein